MSGITPFVRVPGEGWPYADYNTDRGRKEALPADACWLLVESYDGAFDEEGRFHGPGSIRFNSGIVYHGDFSHGQGSGRGKIVWPAGATYEGEVRGGQPDGEGTFDWTDGSSYEGFFVRGRREGFGVMSAANGVRYEGQWRGGLRHGEGRLIYGVVPAASDAEAEIVIEYVGRFAEGRRSGFGMMRYASGALYEGGWRNDKKHGAGVMVWTRSGEAYEGSWVDDLPSGEGVHVWERRTSESRTTGVHAEASATARTPGMSPSSSGGVPRPVSVAGMDLLSPPASPQPVASLHAAGGNSLSDAHLSVTASPTSPASPLSTRDAGDLPSSTPKASGPTRAASTTGFQAAEPAFDASRTAMLSRYEGSFLRGQRHGVGNFYYSDGSRYTGTWREGLKHGLGVMVFADGSVYEGVFVRDKPRDDSASSAARGDGVALPSARAAQRQASFALHLDDVVTGAPAAGNAAAFLAGAAGAALAGRGGARRGGGGTGVLGSPSLSLASSKDAFAVQSVLGRWLPHLRRWYTAGCIEGEAVRCHALELGDDEPPPHRGRPHGEEAEAAAAAEGEAAAGAAGRVCSDPIASASSGVFAMPQRGLWRAVRAMGLIRPPASQVVVDRVLALVRLRHARRALGGLAATASREFGIADPRTSQVAEEKDGADAASRGVSIVAGTSSAAEALGRGPDEPPALAPPTADEWRQLRRLLAGHACGPRHDPSRPVLFREFLEVCVRLCRMLYSAGRRPPSDAGAIEAAGRSRAEAEAEANRRCSAAEAEYAARAETIQLLDGVAPALRGLFERYSAPDRGSLAVPTSVDPGCSRGLGAPPTPGASAHGRAMSVRQLLRLLSDAGLVARDFGAAEVSQLVERCVFDANRSASAGAVDLGTTGLVAPLGADLRAPASHSPTTGLVVPKREALEDAEAAAAEAECVAVMAGGIVLVPAIAEAADDSAAPSSAAAGAAPAVSGPGGAGLDVAVEEALARAVPKAAASAQFGLEFGVAEFPLVLCRVMAELLRRSPGRAVAAKQFGAAVQRVRAEVDAEEAQRLKEAEVEAAAAAAAKSTGAASKGPKKATGASKGKGKGGEAEAEAAAAAAAAASAAVEAEAKAKAREEWRRQEIARRVGRAPALPMLLPGCSVEVEASDEALRDAVSLGGGVPVRRGAGASLSVKMHRFLESVLLRRLGVAGYTEAFAKTSAREEGAGNLTGRSIA